MFGISLVLKLRISEKSTWFAQEWVVFFPLLVIMFYVCSRMWSLMLIIPANPEIKDTQNTPTLTLCKLCQVRHCNKLQFIRIITP